MASWVEKAARKHALALREGPELWANLKVYLRQAVEDYTRIYTPIGEIEVQYSNCLQVTENCARVRVIAPPAKENASLEIIFDPDKNTVSWDRYTVFVVATDDDTVVLKEGSGSGKSFELEEISEKILRPMLDKLPRRKPNLILHKNPSTQL